MRSPEEIVLEILRRRGLSDPAAVGEYLSDRPKLTYDPFLMPDAEAAAKKIHDALSAREEIFVYGDYDVDGIMGLVILIRFLKALPGSDPSKIHGYIPSRFDEGYGLNNEALSALKERGAGLVISVDCGSVSEKEARFAKDIGLDIVISDHHACIEGAYPDCEFVDPKRGDSSYPYTALSGAGVAFKIAQSIAAAFYPGDKTVRKMLNSLVALVAIATVADVVPLADENRTFIKYGLDMMRKSPGPALAKLCEAIGLKPENIGTYQIAFNIAPHLNAAGRMGDASIAAELFLCDDPDRQETISAELVSRNKERRRIQDEALENSINEVGGSEPGEMFIIVAPTGVHEGVAGIVAGKLKDKYGLPAAVLSLTEADGKPMLKGSARSIEGVDLIEMLRSESSLFEKLGGHAMAAGFLLPPENLAELKEAMNKHMHTLVKENPGLLDRHARYDLVIDFDEATLELAKLFEKFEPTGMGNPAPAVRIEDIRPRFVKKVGADGRHLSFAISSADIDKNSQKTIQCILFGKEGTPASIPSEPSISVVGALEVNRWNGRESVRMKIREIQ